MLRTSLVDNVGFATVIEAIIRSWLCWMVNWNDWAGYMKSIWARCRSCKNCCVSMMSNSNSSAAWWRCYRGWGCSWCGIGISAANWGRGGIHFDYGSGWNLRGFAHGGRDDVGRTGHQCRVGRVTSTTFATFTWWFFFEVIVIDLVGIGFGVIFTGCWGSTVNGRKLGGTVGWK